MIRQMNKFKEFFMERIIDSEKRKKSHLQKMVVLGDDWNFIDCDYRWRFERE